MITDIKTRTLIVDVAGVKRRAVWNELDGMTIAGLSEVEMEAVAIALATLRPHHVETLRKRKADREELANAPRRTVPKDEDPAKAPEPEDEPAPAPSERMVRLMREQQGRAVTPPPDPYDMPEQTHDLAADLEREGAVLAAASVRAMEQQVADEEVEALDAMDAEIDEARDRAEESVQRDAEDAGLAEPEEDAPMPWPEVGEGWMDVDIVKSDVVLKPGSDEYCKLTLVNGDRVKVVRTASGLVEEMRLQGDPIQTSAGGGGAQQVAGQHGEPVPDGTRSDPTPAVDPPTVDGIDPDLVPPEHCRKSERMSDTVRWLIEKKGIEDTDKLVAILEQYKAAGVCKSLEKVRDVTRRVNATLYAMGKRSSP